MKMKMNLLLGGLLVGVAIGLTVGGAIVKFPADGSDPQGLSPIGVGG